MRLRTYLDDLIWLLLVSLCAVAACAPRRPVVASGPKNEGAAPVAKVDEPGSLPLVRWSKKPDAERWKVYDELVSQQKYEQAAKIAERRLAGIHPQKDSEAWTRALIRYAKLRLALQGYEKAVRWLKEQPWPSDLLAHTVLHLYYAETLVGYARAHSWEIRQRERVVSGEAVDLRRWTLDQIYEAAQRAYQAVWRYRKQLGAHPVSLLSEHLEINDYPRQIRGTLRDTVSYLWARLLADTSGWRPEHENEIYQLDVARLLGEGPTAKPLDSLSLADPALHPLLKLCAVLDDLERWHAARGAREAALEARLTRLRALRERLTQSADKTRLRSNLRQHLAGMEKLPWWSMGMSLLAELVRAEQAPDRLIRARGVAVRGAKAFPKSVGGQRCTHIVKSIEAPEYRLEAMVSDGLQRRSVGVRYRNLRKLYFRAYRVDLRRELARSQGYELLPNYRELSRFVDGRSPSAEWAVPLEQTTDYDTHRADVTPPIGDPGYYLVVASARPSFGESDNVRQAIYIALGDLVLVERATGDGRVEVSTLSGASGRPIAGVKVWLYQRNYTKGHRALRMATSGADGTVRFSCPGSQSCFLVGQKGAHIALDPRFLYVDRPSPERASYGALVYTDRSIYRPQQTIHFKTVLYRGRSDRADFKVAPNTSLTVRLRDANSDEVAKLRLVTNRYGTASGSFVIPRGRLLGRWELGVSRGGVAAVRVEEYKRPTFEATFVNPRGPLRLNQPASLEGEARYLFGLPVGSGIVKWRVRRVPVYPWWWRAGRYGSRGSSMAGQVVAAGTTTLSADGTFSVRFTPRADERLGSGAVAAAARSALSYRYEVGAEITDEGGETRLARSTFRVGFVAVQAEIVLADGPGFLRDDVTSELTVSRTTLDGAPSPGEGRYRLVRLKMPVKALLPADQPLSAPARGADPTNVSLFWTAADRRRPRWNPGYDERAVLRSWSDGPEQLRGTLHHGKGGGATVALPRLPAGAYRLHYSTQDAFGGSYETSHSFIVAAAKPQLALPAYLMLEHSSVRVGHTARLFAGSGLAGQRMTLDFYSAGKHTERRVLEAGRDSALIEIPITERYRGGFSVTLSLLRDHQLLQFSRSVSVPWDNKRLKLSFSTFRDRLRPGAKETWTVKVSGPAGKQTPVRAAEVLAYMYDRSLDAFAPHGPPSPLSLFPRRTAAVRAEATLGAAQLLSLPSSGFASPPPYPALRADAPHWRSGYGIGGMGVMKLIYGVPQPSVAAVRRQRNGSKRERRGPPASYDPVAAPPPSAETSRAGVAPLELRQNFAETAFFKPHLLSGPDGTVSFQFTVPDSVTAWHVWAHALTRDFKSGSVGRESRSVKELMVRPYLPRFLREGDRAAVKVVVNNASKRPIEGRLSFDIIDPESGRSVLSTFGLSRQQASDRPFSVPQNGGANLTFSLDTPAKVGLVAFRVVAHSQALSDGELRPLPVLPGRMHLSQSRFVVLKDKARRELRFGQMLQADPSRIDDQLVVTVDAQLFYSVLSALPYLVSYPYECTEQTLNRFLSTGILASMYADYPTVERMARSFASRKTQLERWGAPDPNRKMALEETPWLQLAEGGASSKDPLVNVLDPRIARAQRAASLAKLRKAQISSGAFPWFPGGPPSPFITLYILHGLAKGLEFGVDVPQEMVRRGWRYLHQHFLDEVLAAMRAGNYGWEFVTFVNYVLSNYPDASWTAGAFPERERREMLEFSFQHWRSHSPYLKAYLALTLKRTGRVADATLVWDSVMDSAKTTPDQGTYWAPEARSWLWYNDTIETHAFAVRTAIELLPEGQRSTPALDGLVLWLFLNKKLNHWKSTRATAEVVYALAHYLKRTAQLGQKESITVSTGDRDRRFDFDPSRYSGKRNQLVIPGGEIDPAKHAAIFVSKQTPGYAFASATWNFSTAKLPQQAVGELLRVTRRYFKRVDSGRGVELIPLETGASLAVGDEVEVQLWLTSKHSVEYVHLRDPRPAGFEPTSLTSRHQWNLGISWYEEIRDSGTNFFFEQLPRGEYPFKYRLRATMAGKFKAAPATVQPMYAAEFTGYSSGRMIEVD